MSGDGDSYDDSYIVKLRGLPWSATTDDIQKFFRDCKILNGVNGIHLTNSREGRPSGEAFVELEDAEDLENACQKDREHMGNRYIEVFKVNKAEMMWVVKRSGPSQNFQEDGCVRLRGLPFGCSKEEIAQFFTGLEIVPNGITLLTDYSGRSSGEAYVQFVNRDVAEKALLKHREKIGHRYIEIFRSSLSEINSVTGFSGGRRNGPGAGGPPPLFSSRPGPYDRGDRYGGGGSAGGGAAGGRFAQRGSRSFKGPWMGGSQNGAGGGGGMRSGGGAGGNLGGGGGGRNSSFDMDTWGNSPSNDFGSSNVLHYIHMRGLPFKATPAEISDFFKPIVPVSVRILQDHNGRASGEADVEFASHDDALRAMSKDKTNMGHRYIELFLNSTGPANTGMGFGGGRRRM